MSPTRRPPQPRPSPSGAGTGPRSGAAAVPRDAVPPWPALASADPASPDRWPASLEVERAVWGKAHGSAGDFRWLASSPGFPAPDLARHTHLGREDRPGRSLAWWNDGGDGAAAVVLRPSPAADGSGRKDFLEKDFWWWWKTPDLPAAAAAAVLLAAAAESGGSPWWDRRDEGRWEEGDFRLQLAAPGPLEVDPAAVAAFLDEGLAALAGEHGEEELAAFYADLLAGNRPAWLQREAGPLSAAALVALLLPLPRELADRTALAGWLPALRFDRRRLGDAWSGVASDLEPPEGVGGEAPGGAPEDVVERAHHLARAVLEADPGDLAATPERRGGSPGAAAGEELHLALWGATAAGKTALLAQLYIESTDDGGDWKVWPTELTRSFVDDMRTKRLWENRFPPATPVGAAERIVYRVVHRGDGRRALLDVEDRAGKDSQELHPEVRERLQAADGLILLFDLQRPHAELEVEIARTLEEIHIRRGHDGEPDPRPVAVCLSKADLQIHDAGDLEQAQDDPDGFMRRRLPASLLRTFDRFCARYRLFPVSAVGVRLHWGEVERLTFYDETLTPRVRSGGTPIHLRTPFAWLFDELAEAAP